MKIVPYKTSHLLWAGAIPFVVLSILFYPPIYTYMDENVYIALASVLRHGAFYADQAGIQIPFLIWNGKHLIPQYPMGMPSVIALFSLWGWQAIFLIGPISMLIGYYYFARWLHLEGFSERYAWIFLYYPTMVFYSRTVMTESVCAALVTVALFQYRSKRFLLAGFLAGLAVNIRNPLVLIFIALLGASMIEQWQREKVFTPGSLWRPPVRLLIIGALPGLTIAVLNNYVTTGSMFLSPYALAAGQPLNLANLPANLYYYCQSLVVVYPLMLLSIFLVSWRVYFPLLLVLFFYILFHAMVPTEWILSNQWGDLAQRLMLQHRYLLPVIPLLLILYVSSIDKLGRKVSISTARWMPAVLFVLVSIASLIHIYHDGYLQQLADFRRAIYSATPEGSKVLTNYDGLKLMNDVWGKRQWVFVVDDGKEPSVSLNEPVYYAVIAPRAGNRSYTFKSNRQDKWTLLQRVERKIGTLFIYSRISSDKLFREKI